MQIGAYTVEAELARGGMGIVYRARSPGGVPVARKVLHAGTEDDETLERFRREATLQRGLEHPNLVRVLDAGLSNSHPWIAFELVEGGTLEQRVRRQGPLPWREAVRALAEVAAGVSAAHERGLLHRDIKPANVLFAPRGAKLADFGLVKDLDQETLTQTGLTLGTPAYLAPEQIGSEKERWCPATDVYGLAATLYFALTGRPPFSGSTGIEVLLAVSQAPPPSPRALVRSVPPWLDALCQRGLAKQGADRYRDAVSFRAALLHTEVRSASWPRRLIALAAAAALGAGAWAVSRSDGEPDPAPTDTRSNAGERELEAAIALRSAGAYEEAIEAFTEVLEDEPDSCVALLGRGAATFQAGRVEASLSDFERALALEPENQSAWLGKFEVLQALGRHEQALFAFSRFEALGALRSALYAKRAASHAALGRLEDAAKDQARALEDALKPEIEAELRMQHAQVLLKLKRFSRAREVVDPLVQQGGPSPKVLLLRARASRGLGQLKQALADVSAALELDPDFVDAYLERGSIRNLRREHDAAVDDSSRALELEPELVDAHLQRALALRQLGRLNEALADYQRASQLDETNVAAYVGLGSIFRQDWRRTEVALGALSRAVALAPRLPQARMERAQLLLDLGEHEGAIQDLSVVLEQRPALAKALRLRARAHANAGRLEAAIADLDRAAAENPDRPELLTERGALHSRLEHYPQALEDLDRAIELDPDLALPYCVRGGVRATLKQHQRARADFDRALELNPDLLLTLIQRGQAHLTLGELDAALADFECVLAVDATRAQAWQGRGEVRQAQGRYREALADFDRALELAPPQSRTAERIRAQRATCAELAR